MRKKKTARYYQPHKYVPGPQGSCAVCGLWRAGYLHRHWLWRLLHRK